MYVRIEINAIQLFNYFENEARNIKWNKLQRENRPTTQHEHFIKNYFI